MSFVCLFLKIRSPSKIRNMKHLLMELLRAFLALKRMKMLDIARMEHNSQEHVCFVMLSLLNA